MFHPVIENTIKGLLLVSGSVFALLMGLTVIGVVLIWLNGGVV